MKKLLTLFVLVLATMATTFAQDTLTIVAVGQAEPEVQNIGISVENLSGLPETEQKKIVSVLKIIKDDFSFYKNLYNVDLKPTKSDKLSFMAKLIILNTSTIQISLQNVLGEEKISLLETSLSIQLKHHRSFAHDIANEIYEAITKKKSIFKSKIIFVSDRTSRGKDLRKELYVMDFDGERRQRLTHNNSIIISPALSHDNKKLIYTIIETQHKKGKTGNLQKIKNLNLYEMDLQTKKVTLISDVKGINSGAVYSKDGKSIYLTLSYQKNADIFKMDLATKKLTRITTHYADDVDPFINADESLMTMLSGRPGKAMIYTLNPRGVEKEVKRISYVGRFNAAPRFNQAGTEIVFSSWVDNRFDIYRIDSDGKNLVRLTKNFGSNEEPWFSPDGEFIAFTSQRVISSKKAVQDLYIMNREGEIIKRVTDKYGHISTPRWSN